MNNVHTTVRHPFMLHTEVGIDLDRRYGHSSVSVINRSPLFDGVRAATKPSLSSCTEADVLRRCYDESRISFHGRGSDSLRSSTASVRTPPFLSKKK